MAGDDGSYTKVAFAFSPLATTLTTSLPSRGEARYSGRTWAISGDSVLYTGSIELLASIGIEKVEATVSNLRRSDNNASWARNSREVREIQLPEINQAIFNDNGGFNSGSTNSKVVYEEFGGLFDEAIGSSRFECQFVGSDQSAGIAVIGTWNVGSELTGSYGAERTTTNRVRLPSGGSDVTYSFTDSGLTIDKADKTATIASFGPKYSLTSLSNWTNRTDSDDSTNTNRATIRLRHTSLTRFGAWKLVDHADPAALTTTSKGVFAYSPLAATTYAIGDSNYPCRVRAVYTGSTVAIDGSNNLYGGSYQLTVQWNASDVGGRMTAVVSGSSLFSLGGDRVSQVGFEGNFTGVAPELSGAKVRFASGSSEDLTGTHRVKFLGEGIDGPFAVIGDWDVTKGSDTVDGSFGANLVPAP